MLSFNQLFHSPLSLSSRGSSSPPKKIQNRVNRTLSLDVYVSDVSEKVPKKKNLPTVATAREGNWELRQGSKGSFFTLTYLCLLHTVPCAPITCISTYFIIHRERSCRMHIGFIPPAACLLQRRPGEPQQSPGSLWILRILVMLAQVVGRLYSVSPVHLLWGESLSGVLET